MRRFMAFFVALGLFMAVPSFIYADSADHPLIDSLVFESQVPLRYAEDGYDTAFCIKCGQLVCGRGFKSHGER